MEKLIDEKWLIEKGFFIKTYEDCNEYHLNYNQYIYFIYCEDFSLSIGDESEPIVVLPEHSLTIYQHQFENIYYCLTGKKL